LDKSNRHPEGLQTTFRARHQQSKAMADQIMAADKARLKRLLGQGKV